MAYAARVEQTRTNTDQHWFIFDTDVVSNSATEARGAALKEFLDSKVADNTMVTTLEFSDDHLSWTWINTFPDEAAFNAFDVDWQAFKASSLDGIEPFEETVFTDWLTATGSTVTTTFVTT